MSTGKQGHYILLFPEHHVNCQAIIPAITLLLCHSLCQSLSPSFLLNAKIQKQALSEEASQPTNNGNCKCYKEKSKLYVCSCILPLLASTLV